ncbi:MAG: hypothetical protein INQ03_02700 [Candidatus Heimdallarchaeota archaeon]|nr:hypothetical protein [Candidatus Heimdallarchaeota archaeon]
MKELIELVKYDPVDFDVVQEAADENHSMYTLKTLSITNSMGGRIHLYLLIPEHKKPTPAVHFIHWLETEAENSNKDEYLPMARELAQQGYTCILPDCFWSVDKYKFKENPKAYTDNWWKTDESKDIELCRKQIIELCRVQDYLQSLDIDIDRMILAAHDFGAMFGTILSTMGYNFKTFVFMAATARFSDWFRFGSKKTQEELEPYIKSLDFLDPINHVANLPSPGLFQFADDDFYVPVDRAKELHKAAGKDQEIKWYKAKHNMNDLAFSDMHSWILEHS